MSRKRLKLIHKDIFFQLALFKNINLNTKSLALFTKDYLNPYWMDIWRIISESSQGEEVKFMGKRMHETATGWNDQTSPLKKHETCRPRKKSYAVIGPDGATYMFFLTQELEDFLSIMASEATAFIKKVSSAGGDCGILGIEEDALDDEIKKADRKMALLLHPDKCQENGAAEAFKKVGERLTPNCSMDSCPVGRLWSLLRKCRRNSGSRPGARWPNNATARTQAQMHTMRSPCPRKCPRSGCLRSMHLILGMFQPPMTSTSNSVMMGESWVVSAWRIATPKERLVRTKPVCKAPTAQLQQQAMDRRHSRRIASLKVLVIPVALEDLELQVCYTSGWCPISVWLF